MQLPESFLERTRTLLDEDEYFCFVRSLEEEPLVSVRINKEKSVVSNISLEPVSWSRSGYYLSERLTYTFDPLLHAGSYYVQEASSMFLEQVLHQCVKMPVRYLDLCAAPGGKSTLAASALPSGSLIVSNEIIRTRAQILTENIVKWGNPNCVVTHNAPSDFSNLTHYFDVIQTDVPCSGEGMFRKDEAAISEWSVSNVALCASRQQAILTDIWPALRPGGILIYSTCTYNLEENEQNVRFLQKNMGAELVEIEVRDFWQIRGGLNGTNPVYRFMPHRTRGEGLFMAVLRKPDSELEDRERMISFILKQKCSVKNQRLNLKTEIPSESRSWIHPADQFCLESENDSVWAIPKQYEIDMKMLGTALNVLHKGVRLANRKGKDWTPDQELALSTILNKDAFKTVELDWKQSVSYLRREAMQLPTDERGYVLLTYCGIPLGWVKNLGTRANNLYPQEWRIRSGYWPDLFRGLESVVEIKK